jgi:YbgC/YbaW family acyl-CoA thioester hydrolase
MPVVFRTTCRVEFADTDMAGIVHFSNFFRYMEAAEQAFLRSRGLSVAMEWQGEHIGFPRVAAACDFLRPVRFQDVMEVLLETPTVGRKSVTHHIEFHHAGQLVARGRISAVCCLVRSPAHGLQSIEIPAAIRERLLAESACGEARADL